MNWFKRPKKQPEEFVRVLDFETKEITRIPARELAPGMVQAQVEGIEGPVWLDPSQLQMGEIQHPPFDEEIREVLRGIQSAVTEFYPLSLEEWEDGFRRDTHPEREIAIWVHLSNVYRELTADFTLTTPERREYFALMMACVNGPRENVFNVFSPDAITREQAEKAVAMFYPNKR